MGGEVTTICSKIAVKVRASEYNESLLSNCRAQLELAEGKSVRHNLYNILITFLA